MHPLRVLMKEKIQEIPLMEFLGIGPVLWPDHCVQNTFGAEINEKIEKKYGLAIIQKGN